ncbi:MAG: LD-carboxypeptidase [Anaerolineaceae bacterium]|nr:LD-carboxypeptidase [Anaerolineaceae bacterium]
MSIFPPKLNPGDTIGVVSPSNPVVDVIQTQYDDGISRLKEFGFQVLEGQHTHSSSWEYSASPIEKAQDINNMFANPDVKAIICTQGGYTANACLPYLDWDIIRTHLKIFLGISDITVLLNAIHARTGLITFHGPDVMWGFGNDQQAYELNEFNAILVEGRSGEIPANGDRKTIRSGIAKGKLLGGNINCLLKLVGTAYLPDFTGSILALEAIDVPAASFDHMFQQLKQMGIFEQINGILTGYIDGTDNKSETTTFMEDVLLRIVEEYEFPILKTQDFGHNCANTTLPIGGIISLDADQKCVSILNADHDKSDAV